ncbi:MAG: phage tail protein [Nitrosomonadales bacterium]|nr:phage tail protein [Nitrosomonadales bacterium]
MASDRAQILITAVDQTRTALDGIRNNLGRLGDETRRVQGLLAGLGVSLTLGAFAALVKGAIDSADELNKLSQKIGISVDALSTLQFAAQLSDVGLDTLKTGLKGLSANVTEARAGLGEGAALFQALGISVEDTAGNLKSSDTILLEIADRFASFEDGATKTALAVKLFGKSGMDMIPFLNQGSSGIRALMQEAERLGLKLSTETAQAAEAFNDNLTALKASTSGLGITLATELLAPLRVVTDAIREGQGEATGFAAILGGALKTTLEAILVLGVNVAYVFKSMGTEIGGMAAQLTALARLDIRGFKAIGEAMREDAAKARAEVDALSARILNPPQARPAGPAPTTPTAGNTGAATEDMQRMACVLSGGEWRGGRCIKKGAEAKDNSAARLAVLKAQADAEFRLLKTGLDQQKAALDRALDDRLVSIRDYYAQKTRLEQAAIDEDISRKTEERSAQQQMARGGKDEATRLRAMAEVKKLDGEIAVLAQQRGEIEVANAHAAANAERQLANELARVRDRLAEVRGGAGGDSTRARLQREYQPLIEQLQRMGDTAGTQDVARLIDVESDLAELTRFEREYQTATERLSLRGRELQVQKEAGLITETQMRQTLLGLQAETAREVEALIPKMEQLAQSTGSEEAVNRVARLKIEIASLKTVTDEVAVRINGDTQNAFATMFEQIGSGAKSAKDAFADFARSVLASINRIASQKLAESLFGAMGGGGGSGGFGAFISGLFKGFATGGLVSGPGTSTSDSIPARLSAGEYVLRAAAVRRLGVDFLHALNGGLSIPRWQGVRLAFADGGLVPPAAPATSGSGAGQAVRIVNVIDPSLAADYLTSPAGEKSILNILSRNGSAVREILR